MSMYRFDSRQAMLVAPLSHFGRDDLMLAGGKGTNLGELSRAGFDVPPGFVITTAAYDLLLQQNDLQTELTGLLAAYDLNNQDAVKDLSQRIHNLVHQASIPEEIEKKILGAYQELGNGAVAVRSSATAEDLPEAAFAGQQETFLNIVGEEQLIRAVHGCWESLWSERAILYRARQKVEQSTVKLAIVVQQMVPAEVAGVMFTANPITGERNELIIDASPGLGEAVVSGMVTPDHFLVNKRSRRIVEERIGKREVVFRPRPGGGTEQVLSDEASTPAVALQPQALSKLSGLGIAIEHHYGTPQDIEWAWVRDGSTAGKFFILQARPMTALPEPLKVSGPMRLVMPMLAEMWPTRPYPLDMTTFTGAVEGAIGNFLASIIGRSAPRLDDSFLETDGVVIQFRPPQVHPSPGMLITPWIAMWRTRHYDPASWQSDPLIDNLITQARAIDERDLQTLTWTQNLKIMHEALALVPDAMKLRERYFPPALLGLAGLWLLLALARRRNDFGALVSGVRTKTSEINQVLEDLATHIRTDRSLQNSFQHTETQQLRAELETSEAGQAFLEQFSSFLERYGHRETTLTISQPAWRDRPEIVLEILKVLAGTEPRRGEQYEAWQNTRDQLLASSILRSAMLRRLFLKSLSGARAFFQIREDTHFYATLMQPTIRRVSLELGRRLVQAGALDAAEEVFHLRLQELEGLRKQWPPADGTIGEIRDLVARRKALRESLADKPLFDPRLLNAVSQAPVGEDVLLSGTSGSPGRARGPVRIVRDISEFGKLQAGDVLVAPVTNPAWTPLFQRAAAVVVDSGGSASHAAIVAREYGVPAVMGTMNGTRVLTDGQWIQVDGSRGLVLKLEEPNEND
jgi:rifampicin phosphotransferase